MSIFSITITTRNYSATIKIPRGHNKWTCSGFTAVPDSSADGSNLKKLESALMGGGSLAYSKADQKLSLTLNQTGSVIEIQGFDWVDRNQGGDFHIKLVLISDLPTSGKYVAYMDQ